MPGSSALAARDALRVFRMLALAAAACTFVVIIASAVVRHAQGHVWCIEWPACEAGLAAGDMRQPASAGVTIARIAHRLAATVAALLVIAMLAMARPRDPGKRPERWVAVAALVLVIALAAFGAATAESRSPLVPLGNLLGGYALFAVLAAAHAIATPGAPLSPSTRLMAMAALLLVFAEAAQVALIGERIPMLALLHRGLAVACAALVVAIAWALRQRRLALGGALAGILGAVAITGVLAPAPSIAVTLAVMHNASVAILAALLAHVAASPARGADG